MIAVQAPVIILPRHVRTAVSTPPPLTAILVLPGAPRHLVVPVAVILPGGAVTPAQQYAAAQMQLQQAQVGCAQADAYQNYVNQIINRQNTLNDGINQVLQTLADNTSDPNVQDALLNSIGQPNPINDALDQQLQGQASAYETACQVRSAAAQNALSPDSSQQAAGAAQPGAAVPAAVSDTTGQAGDPSGVETAATQDPSGDPAPQASSQPVVCQPATALNPPEPQAPWGPWAALGDSGLVFGLSRVDANTVTWRFLNAGSNTITGMNFNYSFVDATSGQPTTQSDLLPFPLAPGQSVGGWTAYTANTKGSITFTITQISCQ